MPLRYAAVCALAVLLSACGGGEAEDLPLVDAGPEALARLAVAVEPPAAADSLRPARAVFLADGAGATFYDALAAPQDDEAMGFAVAGEALLDGWRWWSDADSVVLGPAERTAGAARPDFAVRGYAERDTTGFAARLIARIQGEELPRLAERVSMLDGRNALLVEVPDSVGVLHFRPVAGDRSEAAGYEVGVQGATLLIARGDSAQRRRGRVPAQWLAVRAVGHDGRGRASADATEETPEAGRRRAFGLGHVAFASPGRVVVAAGPTPQAAARAAEAALRDAERLLERRSARMVALLEQTPFETGDAAFDEAVAWARLSLDALLVRDSARTYLLPGVPGALPTDGRTALRTLDAFLLTGRWEAARGLLTTIGGAQRFDERIDVLGRAPNVLVPWEDGAFTTTDATPIYVAAAGDYVRATGDRTLVQGEPNFWFKTVFAFRGLYNPAQRIGPQLSPEGLLLTREGQAWTRTGAEPDPADRPGVTIEGQGALLRALGAMTEFATIMGVAGRESGRWYADTAAVARRVVERRFLRDTLVVDRYDPRGQPDATPRPNALLALPHLGLAPERQARLARRLAERLAYPWGVATLPQRDSSFHPYLHAPDYYASEEAAFAGTVWTWLAGPLASVMAQTGGVAPAWELMERQAALVEGAGVVGMIPDNLDAHPRGDEETPAAGGAPVQPWSLAELIRVAWGDFAGISYRAPGALVVAPHLPEEWDGLTTRVRVGGGWVGLRMEGGARLRVTLTPEGALPEGAVAHVRAFGLEKTVPLTVAVGDTASAAAPAVTVEVAPGGVEVDGEDAEADARYDAPDGAAWEGFAWAAPDGGDYPVMAAAAAERQLTEAELLRDNILAIPILTQTDPDGDDWGATSTYTYPVGFPDHVLDATYMELAEDDSTTYVRAEFAALAADSVLGYTPTFVALLISTEEGGQREVGRNAQYTLPDNGGYEFAVYVGDGLVVENAGGRVLAEVEPGQGRVFDPENGSLIFALPRRVLGTLPSRTSVTMLVGARTDGGGLGEFRRVERVASRGVGGGKVDPSAPNIYDQVTGSVTR